MEAVLPVEVEILSLRVLSQVKLSDAEHRLEQLNMIDKKRLKALCHDQYYQQRVARSFNRKVCPRHFEAGDLVLRKVLPLPVELGVRNQRISKKLLNVPGPH
ncbi:uncharacterized protein LOC115681973 [Syzygium oleosum]|uniref:uncharacterized protein LOC115681973 n=1 Tax=Syzygium oleosum TaxID=219896 RepID=UPI0011D21E8F|nr:uncharacterized protein LOC115681973 [Syzygium oleosum]